MPIIFPLTPPTAFKAQIETWRPISLNKQTLSSWTGQRQIVNQQGQYWEVDIDLPPLARTAADTINAFLTALGGESGYFYYGPTVEAVMKGAGSGTPVVNGANQVGADLVIDGCTANITGWAKAGDYIGVGGYLHKVLFDANSNSGGNATLTLFPRVRPNIADNTAIIVNSPKGLFYITNPTSWDIDMSKTFTMKLTIRELLPLP